MASNNRREETPENGVRRHLAVLQEDRDVARLVAGETNHHKVGGLQRQTGTKLLGEKNIYKVLQEKKCSYAKSGSHNMVGFE